MEAILDGGVGVSLMTQKCWEKWGGLPMEKTSLIANLGGDACFGKFSEGRKPIIRGVIEGWEQG